MKANPIPLYKKKDKNGFFESRFAIRHQHELNIKEECGIFGISENKDAAALTALGLHALQHRGQEGCGIVTYDNINFHLERRLGLVGDNFTKAQTLERLSGNVAIGHNRYSTSGSDTMLWEIFAWVSMAPLGVPVVPPVYCSTAMASGVMTGRS